MATKKPKKSKSVPSANKVSRNKEKELIIGRLNITHLLKEKYSALKKSGWITLLNAPIERHIEVNTESIRVLIEDMDFQGIYITVNQPYLELVQDFKKAGLNVSKLKFVDAVSQMYGAMPKDTSQCKYVQGPLNISSIVDSVREFLIQMPGSKKKVFVFIDSITTMLLYNHLPRTIKFSKFLTEDLRKTEVNGIMVSVTAGMTSERLINEVKQFCDEVIDIGDIE